MSDQTAPDVDPTTLPAALVELRHARAEIAHLRKTAVAPTAPDLEQLAVVVMRIQQLADTHADSIPAHLVQAALNPQLEAVGSGPSVQECAADDRRWFDAEREGQ